MERLEPAEVAAALGVRAEAEFLCSPWTRAHGIDPIATAGTYDAFLLIEVPLPWPSDVSELPLVAAAGNQSRLRVLAVVPRAGLGGLARVTYWRRVTANRLTGEHHYAPPEELAALVSRLAGGEAPEGEPAGPMLLVCGHGRRDRCCGQLGTRLALELADELPGVEVVRCSHTGGHRFAPTAVTLPDGRLWAHLDRGIVEGIVNRSLAPEALHDHYRGNTALDVWAQVVERRLFEQQGWAWFDADFTATSAPDGDGSARVEVPWTPPGPGRPPVRVSALVRQTGSEPVLDCGQPPELARKSAPQFEVADLRIDDA